MKKIMFNDKYSLTQAVLDGRKTMTRRISKEQIRNSVFWKSGYESIHGYEIKPIYKISELVAIAQCYESLGMNPEIALNDRDGIGFYTKTKFAPGWKNKMFVRADLMPHHIRITNIKIERLQNISDEDCFKEGIFKWDAGQKDIPFYSMCEHHLLPFFGKAHIGYIPSDNKIIGLSKLARIVDNFAKKPQVQERLTSDIADFLNDNLQPKGVAVIMEAEHMCMTMRGARAAGSKTQTSALRGIMRTDAKTRAEVLSLLK